MENSQNILQLFALRVSDWSEKWFPDSYIFALLGVVIVAIASISIGCDGFGCWSTKSGGAHGTLCKRWYTENCRAV